MHVKIVLITIVLYVSICQVKSENSERYCNKQISENLRIKRSKYYHYPQRFYKLPPPITPIRGPFSYTPPPIVEYEEQPTKYKNYKVRKPVEEGLGNEDINNLVKHLTKNDLDRIIDFATDKNKNYDRFREEIPVNFNSNDNFRVNNDFRTNLQPENYKSYGVNNKWKLEYKHPNFDEQEFNFEDHSQNPNRDLNLGGRQQRIVNLNPGQSLNYNPSSPDYLHPLDEEETMRNVRVAYLNSQNGFTDSLIHKVPTRFNTNPQDYEASATNEAPKYVSGTDMYKVENFGNLPLMNYHNSKLHSVSSYHVPHYTVTSSQQSPAPEPRPQKSQSRPQKPEPSLLPIERAPSDYDPKDQSDAHLKAVKIWTYKSKGMSYTVRDDGSLVLEGQKKYER